MHAVNKNFYPLALVSILSLSLSVIFGVSRQEHSLDALTKSTIIPKVEVHSLAHQHSLFSSYLKSIDENTLLQRADLHWEVILPKIKLLKKGNFRKSKLPINQLSEEGIIQTASSFFSDEYYEKLITFNIDAIDPSLTTTDSDNRQLENYLDDSIKSASLQKKASKGFTPSLAKEQIRQKSSTGIQGEKTNLRPIVSITEKEKAPIEATYITTNTSTLKAIAPKEEGTIAKTNLEVPAIAVAFNECHNYEPLLKPEEIVTDTAPLENTEKVHIGKVLTDISKKVIIDHTLSEEYEKEKVIPFYTPAQAAVQAKHHLTTARQALKSNTSSNQPLYFVSMRRDAEKELRCTEFTVARHIFIEGDVDLHLPLSTLITQSLEPQDTCKGNNTSPIKENPAFISLPLQSIASTLQKTHYDHAFTGHMKHLGYQKFLIDTPLKTPSIDSSLCLKTPAEMVDTLALTASMNIVEVKHSENVPQHTAYTESPSKDDGLHISFQRKSNNRQNTPLTCLLHDDKNIGFQEIFLTKMPKKLSKESDLYIENPLPGYLKKSLAAVAASSSVKSKEKNLEVFTANIETSPTKYLKIASDKVQSEITLGAYHTERTFTAAIKQSNFQEEISSPARVITEEKEKLAVNSNISFPKQSNVIASDTLPESPLMYTPRIPVQLDRVILEKFIPITKASFQKDISLPKNDVGTEEEFFYMHPMLSLFTSPNFDIEKETRVDATETNRTARMTGYSLFNWPTLQQLKTDSYPEGFSIDTRVITSTEDIEGQDFACTLRVDEKDILNDLNVHILYILDTSSSIEAHRFQTFKKAIVQSLDYLDKGTTFNIAVVSKGKVIKLRKQGISPTKSGKSYAKRFLRKVEQANKTSTDDIITLLQKEKMLAQKNDTHRSCVLLSDGNFANSIRVESKSLKNLTDIDAGNFSVYTATVSDKNNKSMLSLLAKLNHGFSLFSRTHAAFPRKFSILLKHIKQPVLHDIVVSFPDDETELYINNTTSPTLLAGKNITLFGNTPEKSNGRIFIQGKSGNKWVNILKQLPLTNSRKGRYSLQKKLANQKTLISLDAFLNSGDEKYLSDAKKFSDEYDLHTLVP